jgi:hypothetical protein
MLSTTSFFVFLVISFPLAFLPVTYTRFHPSHSRYMPRPSHPQLDKSNNTWRRVQIMQPLIVRFSPLSRQSIPLILRPQLTNDHYYGGKILVCVWCVVCGVCGVRTRAHGCINSRMPKPNFMKIDVYLVALEPISILCFLISSHQRPYACPPVSLLGKGSTHIFHGKEYEYTQ